MLKIYNHYISRFSILFISIDLILLSIAFFGGIYLRQSDWHGLPAVTLTTQPLLPEAFFFIFFMMLSMGVMGMYQLELRRDFTTTLSRLMPATALCFGFMTLIFYIFPETYLGRGALLFVITLSFFEILLVRVILHQWLKIDFLKTRALVLGTGKNVHKLLTHNEEYYRPKIVGFVSFPGDKQEIPATFIIDNKQSLFSIANQYNVEEIIVAIQERRGGAFPIQELLECKMHGIKVTDFAAYLEREFGHIHMDALHPSWLVFGSGFNQSFIRSSIKRIFDVFASVTLLIVTLPIILITALLIIIEDGFPIFYRQERVGKNGETFMVLKFRSMRKNAEKNRKPQWAATDDPRVTKIGSIIRKLRIDELPQIVNVLKNEMSFVGPRPERPYFVNILSAQVPYYNVRHSIKPGITGWAQVRYPYGSSVEDAIEKLQYDLYYVKNHSLFLDVVILIQTVEVVLTRKGGR